MVHEAKDNAERSENSRFRWSDKQQQLAATTTAVAGHAAEDLTEVGLQNITTVTQEERIENVLDTDAC